MDVESKSFLGLTASFVDENFQKFDKCLNCKLFENTHTGVNIAEFLGKIFISFILLIDQTINEWNIKGKIPFMVTDNAANILSAI